MTTAALLGFAGLCLLLALAPGAAPSGGSVA